MKFGMHHSKILYFLFCLLSGCSLGHSEDQTGVPLFQIESDRIKIDPHSKLLNHLAVISLEHSQSRSVAYESVGKMIALSNPSNDLTGPQTHWTELDQETLQSAHLTLTPEPVGTAYGVTSIPVDFAAQIRSGQSVRVHRYQGASEDWTAAVMKIVPTQDSHFVDVVFRLPNAHDLYPGTNCQVKFPLLQAKAVRVPSTALLHEGLDEYVWQELAPGEFAPHKVALAEGTSNEVILSSGVSSQYRIIGRGAILLKPELRPFLIQNEDSKNAHSLHPRSTQ